MDAKDLNNIQEAYLGIYDEGYVPLRTDDKPYDSEGNQQIPLNGIGQRLRNNQLLVCKRL